MRKRYQQGSLRKVDGNWIGAMVGRRPPKETDARQGKQDRIYAARTVGSFSRDELQDLLDAKTRAGLSYSTVAHRHLDE